MRPFFEDTTRIQKKVKGIPSTEDSLRRWWVQKYNLPPNHELFLSRTTADLYEEFLGDQLVRREELVSQIGATDDLSVKSSLQRQIQIIDSLLGDNPGKNGASGDKLVEYWEHCLAAGIDPDMDMSPADLDG